ncbi:MAG TPA: hypothetical protein VH481_06755 [Nitrososphaeraceae archaeon]|jgi:hypothetical protein
MNISDVTGLVRVIKGNIKRMASVCKDIIVEKNILSKLATEFQRSISEFYLIVGTLEAEQLQQNSSTQLVNRDKPNNDLEGIANVSNPKQCKKSDNYVGCIFEEGK